MDFKQLLKKFNYKPVQEGEYLVYENKYGRIGDMHKDNMGYDKNGNLKIFDATAGKINWDAFELQLAKIKQDSYLKTFEEYLQQNPNDTQTLNIYRKIKNYFKENPYEEDFFDIADNIKISSKIADRLESILEKNQNLEEDLINELKANIPLTKYKLK